jgi:hypothetical protein
MGNLQVLRILESSKCTLITSLVVEGNEKMKYETVSVLVIRDRHDLKLGTFTDPV